MAGVSGEAKLPQWVTYVAIAILSWVLSAYGGYAAASSTTNARISVLESKYDALQAEIADMRADMKDVKADVKTLLQRPVTR